MIHCVDNNVRWANLQIFKMCDGLLATQESSPNETYEEVEQKMIIVMMLRYFVLIADSLLFTGTAGRLEDCREALFKDSQVNWEFIWMQKFHCILGLESGNTSE